MPMASLNTQFSNGSLEKAFTNVPKKFRTKIIDTYLEVKRRYRQARHGSAWDTSGLSAGKFCETVLRFLQFDLTGNYTRFGKHISNFPEECRKLIQTTTTSGSESARIVIPRALVFLYTMRGKRGIGHVGGDVEANEIDAATVVRVCDWIICELIRIYHKLSLEEAQDLVNILSNREIPDIWEVAGKKRVLRNDLSYKQKTLLLIYSNSEGGLLLEDLFEWLEHSNISIFKRDVLKPLHKNRLVEYDQEIEMVFISPLGINEVETSILKE